MTKQEKQVIQTRTRAHIEDRVTTMVKGLASNPNFTDTTNLHEIGLDSLDLVEMVMNIEMEFSVEIPDDEVFIQGTNPTIKQLTDLVNGKINPTE